MSEAIPPLTVDIVFNTSGVNTGVAQANAGLEKITSATARVTSTMSHLKSTMLAVFGGNIATQGFMMLEHALVEAKQEYLDTEVETKRLGQALDNMGIHAEKTREEVLKTAEAYSTLGFQGAESARAMGTFIAATGSVEQSTKLMALAADFARDKHIDLGTAAMILSRATTGNMKAFTMYGITLDKTLPKNKAIAKAFDELNAKIGGQAVAYTKSFEGQMAVLKERMQETFNVVANYVLPALAKFFGAINFGLDYVKKNGGALKVYAIILGTVATALYGTTVAQYALNLAMSVNPVALWIVGLTALGVAFVTAWNHIEWFRKGMARFASTMVRFIADLIGNIAFLLRAMTKIPGIGDKFKGAAKYVQELSDTVMKASKNIDKLGDKKITFKKPETPGGTKPGDPTGIYGNASDLGGAGGGGGATNVQYVTVYASDTNDIYRKLSKAAKYGSPIGAK